ncbi:ABC transporter ATP-binding protein [Acidihalobacter ferrooxydans]|uniref:ABC transporter domain-containing protein n=1 Tax=Acidihalobacter ferrooxydans TaxID=1765967 RepID=A0A1P8UDU3_9GAMM|nr:ATP-binding cassette domain-containing protein [Acidihalobacter ferrooxydans]APZ41959.1 hypothetical protein BW247_01635 [Acidihalobacter ferrooxydans]
MQPSPPLATTSLLDVCALRGSVFADINLQLAAGECVALSGPSGSGKTVLLRALVDLDPNEGEVALDGEPRRSFAPAEWRRSVALVPAEPAWWGTLVSEHFPVGCKPPLAMLGLSAQALDWEVARCSSGERQRLALLRALVREPRVLLLDEATANLDETSRGRVEVLIADFQRSGGAVLWVTHDAAQAARVAQRWLTLRDGRLLQVDTAHT